MGQYYLSGEGKILLTQNSIAGETTHQKGQWNKAFQMKEKNLSLADLSLKNDKREVFKQKGNGKRRNFSVRKQGKIMKTAEVWGHMTFFPHEF